MLFTSHFLARIVFNNKKKCVKNSFKTWLGKKRKKNLKTRRKKRRKIGLPAKLGYPGNRGIFETFFSSFFPENKFSLKKKIIFLTYEDFSCPEA